MTSTNQVRIYDDGRCPFCQWAQRTIARWDRERRLDFRDYHNPAVAAKTPFPFEQLHQRIHVQTPDGQWHEGFFAWIAVLRALPRWRWSASLLGVPPMRWLGPAAYRFVANHRYQVSAWVLRRLGAPRPCDQSCEPCHTTGSN